MNLALGLQAVDEYFREGDRRKTREYQQALRDSEMSLLPDRAESLRSGYRDTTETNAARARMRPGQTDLSMAQTDWSKAQTNSAIARQPDVDRAAAASAKAGASNAEFGLGQLPTTQETTANSNSLANFNSSAALDRAPTDRDAAESLSKVNAAVAGEKENQIPQMLNSMKVKGILSEGDERDAVFSALARQLRSNDATGALKFANQIAQIPGIMPNTNGKVFTSIEAVADGTDSSGQNGPGYVFKTQDGQQAFITSKTMVDAYQRTLGNPKFEFLHDKNTGEVIRTNERTGDAQVVREAQPGRVRGFDKMPADVQKAEWLIKNKIATDEKSAWIMLQTVKEKSRGAFIQDYVLRNTGMGQDSSKLGQQAAKIYDDLRRMEGGPYAGSKPAAPSNSAAPGTVDPRFNSLLGIK